jgi:hypothetical protein
MRHSQIWQGNQSNSISFRRTPRLSVSHADEDRRGVHLHVTGRRCEHTSIASKEGEFT